MGRLLVLLACLAWPAGASAHELHLDHAPPSGPPPASPPLSANSGGPGATWEFLATIPTGNPHTDLDFFTRGGDTYASVGTLAAGPNGGGQTIVQLTQGGRVAPRLLAQHPSASCVSNPGAATGLQHDVEAAPKGGAILNADVLAADRRDTQLIIDATDADGRCHDQGVFGFAQAPQGGLEIVDVTDPARPKEIGLTSHTGEAHTVNVDPKRPHIAYAVTSDAIAVDAAGKRNNENRTDAEGQPNPDRFDLDGFEVVDLSSCMNFPAGTSLDAKRAACRPEVYRYRYPSTEMSLGHTNTTGTQAVFGCHELEVYPDDQLTCASGNALIRFDMSGAFDDRGTPTDYSDDKPRGTPLPCRVRGSSSGPGFTTGAQVTDCVTTPTDTDALAIPDWLDSGAPSLTGVRWLGSAFHPGRESTTGAASPRFDSTQDIDFDHEAERTASGRFLFASDERGGGIAPPGASCSPTVDNKTGNGGLHFYRDDGFLTRRPTDAADAQSSYALNSDGGRAIFRVPIRTKPQGSLCTAHVFQQIPGQNRIFMGWYSQGTHVIDFTELPNGRLDIKEAGWFIPTNADEWVSHVFKVEENSDGTFTYYGATGDFALGDAGRNAVDVWKVTLPAPPTPAGRLPGTGAGFRPEPLRCVPARARMTSRGLGRVRLGYSKAAMLGVAGRATRVRGNVWTYCVRGTRRGRVQVVFPRRGGARLVASNWRGHSARGVRPSSRAAALRRAFRLRRALGRGFSLAHRRSRVVFAVRRARVRWIAAVDRRLARSPSLLRVYARRAGVR